VRDSAFLQFQKDAKDAQQLLKKVDTDLDQKYSPEFKDRYQLESLLRELDVSTGRWRTLHGAAPMGMGTLPCSLAMLLPPFTWLLPLP